MYIYYIIGKIHKNLIMIKIKKTYPSLPMLLLEGGLDLGHLGNLIRHMGTAPMQAPDVPTMCRNRRHTYSGLHLLLRDGGRCLPTDSASADMDV